MKWKDSEISEKDQLAIVSLFLLRSSFFFFFHSKCFFNRSFSEDLTFSSVEKGT